MKIAIDCRLFGNSGIGTFIKNIVDYIVLHKNISFLLIGRKDDLYCYRQYANVEIQECSIKPFSLKEIFGFPTKQINQCDAFFTPYINIPLGIKIPVFSTIHDAIFFDLKDLTSTIGRCIRWLFYKYSCWKSKAIFTVSNFSRERIIHHFHPKAPIAIVYNGVAKHLKNNIENGVKKKEYILYVGNIKPHKGLKTLIEAYQLAKEKGFVNKLIIVGEYKNFKTTDNEFLQIVESDKENVIFTGRLSDVQLMDKIKEAKALVLPSFYEGFGIPPLEALYLGTDAIISDILVLKEIYSELPVTFFETGNSKDLSYKLLQYKRNTKLDFEQARQNIDNKYNFSITADNIIQIIKNNL